MKSLRRCAPKGGRNPVDRVAALPWTRGSESRGLAGRNQWNTQPGPVFALHHSNITRPRLPIPAVCSDEVLLSRDSLAQGRVLAQTAIALPACLVRALA